MGVVANAYENSEESGCVAGFEGGGDVCAAAAIVREAVGLVVTGSMMLLLIDRIHMRIRCYPRSSGSLLGLGLRERALRLRLAAQSFFGGGHMLNENNVRAIIAPSSNVRAIITPRSAGLFVAADKIHVGQVFVAFMQRQKLGHFLGVALAFDVRFIH